MRGPFLRAALALACLAWTQGGWARDWRPGDSPDTLLVVWKGGVDDATLAGEAVRLAQPGGAGEAPLRQALHARARGTVLRALDSIQVDVVRLAAGSGEADVDAALKEYRASALVASADPDRPVRMAQAPCLAPSTDLYLAGGQNSLTETAWPQAVAAACAGTVVLQSVVTVALLDTGVSPHPDLSSGQLLAGGANYVGGTSTADDNGHGTFCAGILAASPTTSHGIYGTFFDPSKIRILPVKVLDCTGDGYMSAVTSGVVFAVAQGAKVLSISIQSAEDDPSLSAAISAARAADVLVVAAAGNGGGPTSFPAGEGPVVSVAALDHTGAPAVYSNSGKVDLSAPGGDALNQCPCVAPSATVPGLSGSCGCPLEMWSLTTDYGSACAAVSVSAGCVITEPCGLANGYAAASGTSFACPQVSAAAALLFSQDPTRHVADVEQLLFQSALPTSLGSGYNTQTGWGKLNVAGALALPLAHNTGPGAPLKIYNWPNPFNPSRQALTTLTFFLPQAGPADVRVFDADGGEVRHWSFTASDDYAGMNEVTWDGRNGRGVVVANGAYLMELECGGARAVNRIGVLR